MILAAGRSLKAQLTVLCLGLLLPTLFFVAILFWRLTESETTRAEEEALGASRGLASALDRETVGVLATLQALSTSPSLQAGDLAGFSDQINEVRRIQRINILLRDTESRVLLSTRTATGGAVVVPAPLAEADQKALTTGVATVTDMFFSPSAGGSVFQIVGAPVQVDGKPKYLLSASLEPDYLSNVFRRESLLPGWVGSLVDRNFAVVARTDDQERYLGKPSSPALRSHAAATQSGIYRGLNIAGAYSLIGFTRSELTGWTASVNVPVSVVYAPLRRSLLLLSALGVILALFAGLLTLSAGRRIVAATNRLRIAADAIGDGRPVPPLSTPISEINRVGEALHRAAAQLEERARERDAAEASMQAARDAAEQANTAKSTFIANMSHELRTPLSAIIGYSEMMREEVSDGADPGEFDADLAKIENNARHLLGLINDVLDLSKIESGKMEVFAETFEVEPLMRDVANTIESLIQKKENTLVLDLGDDLGSLSSDVTKVRQSLLNLLSNAAKFTERGTITLIARREETQIALSVRDSGIGMSEEQLAKLFERFSQADASTTRRFGGTGLGLSITRAFVSMLGGTIDVTSQPGQGSCFTIRLPLDAAAAPAAPAEPLGVIPREAVLVIDDDPAQRDIMSRFLEREGFAAHSAPNGSIGLALARALRPRAILLDVDMPGLDGWSVLRLLKAEPDLADIPVVMVTFIHDNGLSTALGATDHVTKPVRWDTFRKTMDQFRDAEGDVLVVDDNEDTRKRMRVALERDHWTVIEASNGQEALEKVAAGRPSVVLLDLEMPVMDGFAFLHAFRDLPGCRDIPVVVVTARDLTRADRENLQGADKVVSKGDGSLRNLSAELIDLTRRAISYRRT